MRLSIFEEFYHITYFIHVFFESNFYEQKNVRIVFLFWLLK